MWQNIGLEKCISFIESEFLPKGKPSPVTAPIRPAITISRMTGAGGHTVASNLADYLQTHIPAHDRGPFLTRTWWRRFWKTTTFTNALPISCRKATSPCSTIRGGVDGFAPQFLDARAAN